MPIHAPTKTPDSAPKTISRPNTDRHIVPSLTAQELLNNPEWGRLPRSGQRLMGFSRSSLYLLATEGRITTKSLKRHGQKRGIRFVHLPSLTALIESAAS